MLLQVAETERQTPDIGERRLLASMVYQALLDIQAAPPQVRQDAARKPIGLAKYDHVRNMARERVRDADQALQWIFAGDTGKFSAKDACWYLGIPHSRLKKTAHRLLWGADKISPMYDME